MIDPYGVFYFFIYIFGLMCYLCILCNSRYYRKNRALGTMGKENEIITLMEEEGATEDGDKEWIA